METKKMNAAVLTGYGAPDKIKYGEVDLPIPKENEVLVKVLYSSSTRADSMIRRGKPYFGRFFLGITKPKHTIPGTGFAGVIISKGAKVNNFEENDEVFGESTTNFSANAEYITISMDEVIIHKPQNLSFEEAATYSDGHLTSINFLKNVGEIQPGQRVLIIGASGSLGTSAVQLAKYYGAEVTGVSSNRNISLVKSLGADFVIDYSQENFLNREINYDLIYDTIGISSFGKVKKVLSKNGKYISPVLKLSLLFQMFLTSLIGNKKARFDATGMKKKDELKNLLFQLIDIFKEGKLKTVIDRQFPLEKVAQAHAYIDTGHKKGNVVITSNH
ncbi:MAG: NAD(P)-dependent alcohol dehydrogenase [Candidatus Kapaibacterium sp.]